MSYIKRRLENILWAIHGGKTVKEVADELGETEETVALCVAEYYDEFKKGLA